MSQLDRWIQIAALVPVAAFGVATLVASGGGTQPTEITTVERPRVAMLNADVAAITYFQTLTNGLVVRRELFRSRHTLSTGTSDPVSRSDVDRVAWSTMPWPETVPDALCTS